MAAAAPPARNQGRAGHCRAGQLPPPSARVEEGMRRRGAEISSGSDATSCVATYSLRARALGDLDGAVAVGGGGGGPRLRGVLASVSSPTRGGELRPRIWRGRNAVEQREQIHSGGSAAYSPSGWLRRSLSLSPLRAVQRPFMDASPGRRGGRGSSVKMRWWH
jgi:hypothetical protein